MGNPPPTQPPYAPPGSPEVHSGQLAGWWRRVGGVVIDDIIVGIAAALVSAASHRELVILLAGWAVSVVYVSILLVRNGQTLGMAVFGVRLQMADADGSRISGQTAVSRSVVAIAFTLPQLFVPYGVLLAAFDLLWPLWDERNQTLHDKVVGTLAVRT